MNKMFFYEKLSEKTMKELDAFLANHPKDKISYYEWREALSLQLKVLKELAESTQEYGERVDKILENYKDDLNSGDDIKMEYTILKVNRELSNIGVIPNSEVEEKLRLLCRKHYL